MDEKLQAQIAEAKAQGYTDEQIDAFLNPKPVEQASKDAFVDRSEEATGLAQYGVGKAAQLGAELGGGYYVGKKLLGAAGNAFRGGPAPVAPIAPATMPTAMIPEVAPMPGAPAPTTLSAGANPAFDAALARSPTPGPVLSSAVPAAAFSAPYAMAAYEQSKIRANPNAAEYASNPYAMQQRGEYATQGAAGAANQRSAVANQQYGGLTEAEQLMLDSDRLSMAIRLKAAKKVLGQ